VLRETWATVFGQPALDAYENGLHQYGLILGSEGLHVEIPGQGLWCLSWDVVFDHLVDQFLAVGDSRLPLTVDTRNLLISRCHEYGGET
jgi:hypothetical protein